MYASWVTPDCIHLGRFHCMKHKTDVKSVFEANFHPAPANPQQDRQDGVRNGDQQPASGSRGIVWLGCNISLSHSLPATLAPWILPQPLTSMSIIMAEWHIDKSTHMIPSPWLKMLTLNHHLPPFPHYHLVFRNQPHEHWIQVMYTSIMSTIFSKPFWLSQIHSLNTNLLHMSSLSWLAPHSLQLPFTGLRGSHIYTHPFWHFVQGLAPPIASIFKLVHYLHSTCSVLAETSVMAWRLAHWPPYTISEPLLVPAEAQHPLGSHWSGSLEVVPDGEVVSNVSGSTNFVT